MADGMTKRLKMTHNRYIKILHGHNIVRELKDCYVHMLTLRYRHMFQKERDSMDDLVSAQDVAEDNDINSQWFHLIDKTTTYEIQLKLEKIESIIYDLLEM
ncbi:hypothetical protein K0M31_001893 [Melipona bicolor]|uniref:Uncharacterized protein n=1 Tax=Melipona bicolor TaxID=60889 RepID=A0AA40GGF3_9HYME|nr:hypothetical protein K0M31_001893 [Melipona bicolor]